MEIYLFIQNCFGVLNARACGENAVRRSGKKKGTKYEMKEFFLNFAMHWFNFTYIKTNRHIQIDTTSIRVRKFKDWRVPCSHPASTFPNFSPYSSQRTTVGTLSSRPSSQGGPPEIEIQSSRQEGQFSMRVPSCRPECWEIRRKTPSKFQYSTTSWSSL